MLPVFGADHGTEHFEGPPKPVQNCESSSLLSSEKKEGNKNNNKNKTIRKVSTAFAVEYKKHKSNHKAIITFRHMFI
jgi:hypothetical protein